jgi:hypothetical protein
VNLPYCLFPGELKSELGFNGRLVWLKRLNREWLTIQEEEEEDQEEEYV